MPGISLLQARDLFWGTAEEKRGDSMYKPVGSVPWAYLHSEISSYSRDQSLCPYSWEEGLVDKMEASSMISFLTVINISRAPAPGGQDFRPPMTLCCWDVVVFGLRSGDPPVS